jgi:hypothetical protein
LPRSRALRDHAPMQSAYPYFSIAAETLRAEGYRYDAERALWRDRLGMVARIERRWRSEVGSRRRLEYVIVLEARQASA